LRLLIFYSIDCLTGEYEWTLAGHRKKIITVQPFFPSTFND
jgi:hypothetical protein